MERERAGALEWNRLTKGARGPHARTQRGPHAHNTLPHNVTTQLTSASTPIWSEMLLHSLKLFSAKVVLYVHYCGETFVHTD